MKNIKKIVILLLIICFSIEPIAVLSSGNNIENSEEKNIVEIYTEEEFLSFSEQCKLDSFSRNKKVILKNDINLSDYDFQGIPIFLGDFDGNYNTISGIEINAKEDYQGVFRYISEGASVSNLKIEGVIEVDANYVGGIAGQNKGEIFNSEFNGEIIGKSNVGGISGENIGTIEQSKSYGVILGQSVVGGIVGKNTGDIIGVENNSEVNTEIISNEVSIAEVNTSVIREELLDSDIVDIGGISGINLGVIQDSDNNGNIGYSHIGYNIGGISGRHSGYISNCENVGSVFGRKEVGGIVGQFEPHISSIYSPSKLQTLKKEITLLSNMISNLNGNAKLINVDVSNKITELNNSINSTKDDVEDLLDKAEDIIEEGVDPVVTVNESLEEKFIITDEDYKNLKDKLSNSLNDVSEGIEHLNQSVYSNTEMVIDEIESINIQFNVVMTLMIDILTDVVSMNVDGIFEVDDISYENSEDIKTGKITKSNNTGKIDGDINIGGIAGAISFEITFDREDDYKKDDNDGVERRSGIAIIDNSINTGDVIGKKDSVGGIIGYMDFGFIEECTSIAKIESLEGDYVGGIAGYSEARIDLSYSKNIISGKSYIGGIVGYGKNIENNYSMSTINSENGFKGGIAGDTAEDSIINNNFFVNDTLGGISGISFEGKAEPINYEELINTSEKLEIFKNINVEFFVDDIKNEVIEVGYMENISEEDIPEVPEKEGMYGYWEEFNTDSVTDNVRVNAIYEPIITTISSDKLVGNLSRILVDGSFDNTEKIIVSEYRDNEESALESYEVELNNENNTINKVRYLSEEEIESIEVLENSKWVEIEIIKDGKYIVFENINDTNKIVFRVIKDNGISNLVIAGISIVFILICLFYSRRYVKRNKKYINSAN